MIRYLLDTDTLSLLQGGEPNLIRRINRHLRHEIANSTVSIGEQLLGWHNAVLRATDRVQIAAAHDRLASHLLPSWKLFAVLSYSEPAILRFDQLKTLRLNIGSNDRNNLRKHRSRIR